MNWKKIQNFKPSTQDLKQIQVYNDYWKSFKAVLLYPTDENSKKPVFSPYHHKDHECGIGKVNVLQGEKLNPEIGEEIINWFRIVKKDFRKFTSQIL